MRSPAVFQFLPENKFKLVTLENTSHAFGAGDCLDVMRYIPNKSLDLIITDPPYNRDINYGGFYKDRMKDDAYFDYINERIGRSIDLLKDTGSLYVITYPEQAIELHTYLKSKLKFRRWLTWHYPTNIGHSKKNFTRSQRTILFFTKTSKYTFNRNSALLPYKNPKDIRIRNLVKNGSKGRMMYDTIYPDDLLKFNLMKNINKNRQQWHRCQLPFDLLGLLIRVSSNKKDTIFDPFAGTFSLNLVASELSRNSIGLEINPKYVKLGIRRIKK